MLIDFSACIITGGGARRQVENARAFYSDRSSDYFSDMLGKRGKALADSACGFLLLDSLLQKHKINRAELGILLDENGRPRTTRRDVDFSVSHSEGCAMAVLAIGENAEVGVDVQRERPYSLEKVTELARAFMNVEEWNEFSKPPESSKPIPLYNENDVNDFMNDKNKQFYTAWTRRESFTKRIGSDIFDNLRTAELAGERFIEGVISSCGERYYYSISAPAEYFEELERERENKDDEQIEENE